jgi:hypothetical protein
LTKRQICFTLSGSFVLATGDKDTPMSTHNRRYLNRMFPAMLGYAVLLVISRTALRSIEGDAMRFAIALMPAIPLALALMAFMAYLREMDEMQRRIQFEAFGFSLACTVAVTLTLGLLESAGFPHLNLIWVATMLIGFWGLGSCLASRRYQ